MATARLWLATGGEWLDLILAGEADVLPESDGPKVMANFSVVTTAGR